MAVKPITNKQALVNETVNRAKQLSTRSEKITGNRSKTLNPGKDFTKNFSVTLKDIDTSVISHIKDIMTPTIREANETIKVPILYANEERWKNFRKRGVLRDKNGSLILPLIMIKRTDTSFNDQMPLSFDHDVSGEFVKVVRAKKYSPEHRYDRFSVQTGMKPSFETITTGMPDFVLCNYNVVILTNYIEQMNHINELFLEHLETYWGGKTEYKFLSGLDGAISNVTEMEVTGERLIKNEFGISIKGYVIPEYTNKVTGHTAEIARNTSPNRVTFGTEGDATTEQIIGKK
tara:strand:+ start:160 stop:1029 length:870 start_codon:yes stop_codon:yes gene_type:complete